MSHSGPIHVVPPLRQAYSFKNFDIKVDWGALKGKNDHNGYLAPFITGSMATIQHSNVNHSIRRGLPICSSTWIHTLYIHLNSFKVLSVVSHSSFAKSSLFASSLASSMIPYGTRYFPL